MNLKSAISAIERNGILLVFPMNNKKEPASLWSVAYPRSKMLWEWDSGGDNRVANLWHLREELSRSRKVVYVKWYQGRATFFSRTVFSAMLRIFHSTAIKKTTLGTEARLVLETLESDSPLSTKQLKKLTDLQGRANEARYSRALKELFTRLLIVGFGEVDEGAFPSLAVGATQVLFEDLWNEASEMDKKKAFEILGNTLAPGSLFLKYFMKTATTLSQGTPVASSVVHYD
jgi:hypothetical protein